MLYRDIIGMGRVPVDVYQEPIRGLITFIIPVGLMISFPVKSFLGILNPLLIFYTFLFSLLFFYFSLKIWGLAVKNYSSASS